MPRPGSATVTLPGSIPARLLSAVALAIVLLLPAAPSALAAGPTMEAHALLDGHARVGSWMAISVTLTNDGPEVDGEIRIAGGAQGRTRFGLPIELPTGSRKTVALYAQPPAFGQTIDVSLVGSNGIVAAQKVAFSASDPAQTVVGVIAENPQRIISALRLPNNQQGQPPAIFALKVTDLPDRVEAWSGIDRIVWQDVDSSTISTAQLAALRGWVAGGGRLTVIGGTSGPAALSGLPDDLLPYRPTATRDVDASALVGLVGQVTSSTLLPALAGATAEVHGTVLATSGDRAIAAENRVGNGMVTLVGVDPTGDWLTKTPASDALWNRLVPLRTSNGLLVSGDDSQLLSALNTLPSLALPPVGGLIALLAGYIVLIGPVNYFVLRRFNRREWAWVTMPLLVVGFAVAAFVYGNTLRGGQVIINQLAIVRGSPGTTEGLAQVYVGVFSPTRETYQLAIPGGALLSAPTSSDMFGGFDGSSGSSAIDILQGDTARVRDLVVGYGALRAVRADAAVQAPKVSADLRLDGDHLKGAVHNESTITIERPVIVLGGSVAILHDLAPGATETVDVRATGNAFGQSLGDRMFGSSFLGGDPFMAGEDNQRLYVRQAMLNQISFDQMTGMQTNLGLDGPVLIGFGRGPVLDARVDDASADTTGNILYYVPLDLTLEGKVIFTGDLMRGTTISADSPTFSKGDPFTISFQDGTVTQSYQPNLAGRAIEPTRLVLQVNQSGSASGISGPKVTPTGPADGPPTKVEVAAESDGVPTIEIFDVTTHSWMRLGHVANGAAADLAEPARYVDPNTGAVLIRFRSDRQDGVGFQFQVQLEGTIH